MTVKIRFMQTSRALELSTVTNAYTKGNVYCVYFATKKVTRKFPLCNIFDIEESYEDELHGVEGSQ